MLNLACTMIGVYLDNGRRAFGTMMRYNGVFRLDIGYGALSPGIVHCEGEIVLNWDMIYSASTVKGALYGDPCFCQTAFYTM